MHQPEVGTNPGDIAGVNLKNEIPRGGKCSLGPESEKTHENVECIF